MPPAPQNLRQERQSVHVHEEILESARRLAAARPDWTFTLQEIVSALPALNSSTVRTHVVSRCCVNAPKNHPHKWDYFRRVGRGRYRIEVKYRRAPTSREPLPQGSKNRHTGRAATSLRRTLHAVIQNDGTAYVVECLELPVVTQGYSLDEAVQNFREALALHLEGEDLAALGLMEHPDVHISYEMPAA
jgi:predicted RNase H-like HicB family nuclease